MKKMPIIVMISFIFIVILASILSSEFNKQSIKDEDLIIKNKLENALELYREFLQEKRTIREGDIDIGVNDIL